MTIDPQFGETGIEPTLEREIVQLEEALKAAKKLTDPVEIHAFYDELFDEELIDIHASGWIYSREQSIELEKNIAARGSLREVLRASSSEHQMKMLAANVVAVSALHETYYEEPNPQMQSIRAGTFTLSPNAIDIPPTSPSGPGEDYAPNPYRTRITHVWVKTGDRWKLSLSQATRLGKRLRLG